MSVPAVRMAGIVKRFGAVTALDGFDLEVPAGGILALLGPSGCGKTTALRLICGFEQPDAGSIEINGRQVATPMAAVPPERRRVGMVFQDFALFPHLNVRDNVGYGIRRDPDQRVRVNELLAMVGLTGDADRLPHQLSGGMQQRVALARALAPRPDVILLDEPFSNLDQALRTQLRGEVREILRRARTTAVFVTHDQDEALTVADHVCVMSRGRVEQCATPEIIYAEPATAFVASFVGTANFVHADCAGGVAHTAHGPVRLLGPAGRRQEGRALVVLRPEHFDVGEAPDGPSTAGGWRVLARRFAGAELLYLVARGDEQLWCEAGPQARRLSVGDTVRVQLRDVESVAFSAPQRPPRASLLEIADADRAETSELPDAEEVPAIDRAAGPPP
ncbi:MAG TPA: ABC transporter ATP-binding protein [Candidatus Limnocylindria bacterium]|jgi:iron(III) transport system ATP-binding protein|nr:ABC transporter ATP-binding protein [Candidatus Limnocylindria bacterium]